MKTKLTIIGARVQHALDDLAALKQKADLALEIYSLLDDADEALQEALAKIDSAELLL